MNNAAFSSSYSGSVFWGKIGGILKKVGAEVLRPALLLYYTLQKPDLPAWAKATIMGALGYFISPLDAIPDITPVIGYTDDIAVMGAALATVAAHIDKDARDKADRQLEEWFG